MKYLALSGKSTEAENWIAWFADDLPAVATGSSRADAVKRLHDMLTDAYFSVEGRVKPNIERVEDVDAETLEGVEQVETAWLELADLNPMAEAIWSAMNRAGVGPAEIARRMGISRAAASKLLDPNRTSPYSLDTLERIATALGMRLELPRFVKPPADATHR
jgi:transcriptional regulator with XRE-family HTH domain